MEQQKEAYSLISFKFHFQVVWHKWQTGQGSRKKVKEAGREAALTVCVPRVVAFWTKLKGLYDGSPVHFV